MLSTACTEKAPAPAANPSNKETEAAQATPLTTNLQITPKPDTTHTVGKFDPATNTMIAEKGQTGALMFGPYAKLAPGHYQATFLVTAESGADGTEVGMLDVNGFTVTTPSSTLATVPLKSAHGEQTIKLTFDATDPKVAYEFRIFVNGKGDRTSVRSVLVEKH